MWICPRAVPEVAQVPIEISMPVAAALASSARSELASGSCSSARSRKDCSCSALSGRA